MSIQFFAEDVSIPSELETQSILSIIDTIVSRETSKELDYINYIFCSDDYLLNINNEYLQHDYYTDIITFDYSEEVISSDIFVSIDRIIDNAKTNSVSFQSELHRVIIHGVLHLVGYNDKTDGEQTIMTQKEDFYLQLMQ